MVLTGKDRGKEGDVIRVLPDRGKVIVDGVNIAKKHQKPTRATMQGGIIDKDMPMPVSQRGHRCARKRQADPRRLPASTPTARKVRICQASAGGDLDERRPTPRHRVPRLKQRYNDEIRGAAQGPSSASPTSCRCRGSRRSSSTWASARATAAAVAARGRGRATSRMITGQKPIVTKAKKSIAGFKLREGNAIGAKVTLRGDRMWEFFDRLISLAIPRIRDFRGLPANSFDGRGNYTFGVTEQLIFPEIDYDKVDATRGMDITIVTTARTDAEGKALLDAFGFPFRA